MKANPVRDHYWIAVLICLGWSIAVTQADVLLNNNFDSNTVGTVPTGWSTGNGVTSNSATVSNAHSVSTPNSMELPLVTGSLGLNYSFNNSFTSTPSGSSHPIEVTFDLYVTAQSASRLMFLYNSDVDTPLTEVGMSSNGTFTTGAGFSLSLGNYLVNTWYQFKIDLTLSSGTYNVYVNQMGGGLIGSQINIPLLSSANFGAIYFVNDSSSSNIFVDNVLAETNPVPEPHTLAMAAIGFGGLLGLMHRHRK